MRLLPPPRCFPPAPPGLLFGSVTDNNASRKKARSDGGGDTVGSWLSVSFLAHSCRIPAMRDKDIATLMKDAKVAAFPCRAAARPEHNPFINRRNAYAASVRCADSIERSSSSSLLFSPESVDFNFNFNLDFEDDDEDIKQCCMRTCAAMVRSRTSEEEIP